MAGTGGPGRAAVILDPDANHSRITGVAPGIVWEGAE